MSMFLNILIFVFVLGVIILIHESGHFYFAKKAGVLCHEFSFGMGPLLWSTKKGETKYCIRAIPIGGYVAMAGEDMGATYIKKGEKVKLMFEDKKVSKIIIHDRNNIYQDIQTYEIVEVDLLGKNNDMFVIVSDEDGAVERFDVLKEGFYVDNKTTLQFSPFDRCLDAKPVSARIKTLLAGPLSNFVLGFVILIVVGMMSGMPSATSTELGSVIDGYPAAAAGLESGDVVLSIDGKETDTWVDITEDIHSASVANGIEVEYNRDGEIFSTTIYPKTYIYSLGISNVTNTDSIIIYKVTGTKAEEQGFMENDELISIDGVKIVSWEQVATIMSNNIDGDFMEFVVLRNGEELTLQADPYSKEIMDNQNIPISATVIGVSSTTEFNLVYSFKYAAAQFSDDFTGIFDTLRLLFTSDEVGASNLSGPVGIFSVTSNMASQGLVSLLTWIAFLSINIGVLNLLPIPALDGGQLLFIIIELIIHRELSSKFKNSLNNAVYILLMAFMVYVTFNDIARLF